MVAAAGTLGQTRRLLPRHAGGDPVRRGGRHVGRRLPEASRLVPRPRGVRGLAEGRGVTGHRGGLGAAGRGVGAALPCPVPPPCAFWRAAARGRRPSRRGPPGRPERPCSPLSPAGQAPGVGSGHPCRPPPPSLSARPAAAARWGEAAPARPGGRPSGARRGGGCWAGAAPNAGFVLEGPAWLGSAALPAGPARQRAPRRGRRRLGGRPAALRLLCPSRRGRALRRPR